MLGDRVKSISANVTLNPYMGDSGIVSKKDLADSIFLPRKLNLESVYIDTLNSANFFNQEIH